MSRDESLYPDPETFRPERWLDKSYPTYREPLTQFPTVKGYHQFGFGRRLCQGVELVEANLLCAVGGIAWAFTLSRKRDEHGRPAPIPWKEYSPHLITKPVPFAFDLKARSERRRQQVIENWAEAQESCSPAEKSETVNRRTLEDELWFEKYDPLQKYGKLVA